MGGLADSTSSKGAARCRPPRGRVRAICKQASVAAGMARCRGHTCNAGALTFHRLSARRKCGDHGAHGEGVMLLAEPSTDRVIGLAIEVHRHTGPGLLESFYAPRYAGNWNKLAFKYGARPAFRRYTKANLYPLDSRPISWWKKPSSLKLKRSGLAAGT